MGLCSQLWDSPPCKHIFNLQPWQRLPRLSPDRGFSTRSSLRGECKRLGWSLFPSLPPPSCSLAGLCLCPPQDPPSSGWSLEEIPLGSTIPTHHTHTTRNQMCLERLEGSGGKSTCCTILVTRVQSPEPTGKRKDTINPIKLTTSTPGDLCTCLHHNN